MNSFEIPKSAAEAYYVCPDCGHVEDVSFWKDIRWLINNSPEILAGVYFIFGVVLSFSIVFKALNDFEAAHPLSEICQGVK